VRRVYTVIQLRDIFAVTLGTILLCEPSSLAGSIVHSDSGLCLSATTLSGLSERSSVTLQDCSDQPTQDWTITVSSIQSFQRFCITAPHYPLVSDALETQPCRHSVNQLWFLSAQGQLSHIRNRSLCLAPQEPYQPGSRVVIEYCTFQSNQTWLALE
jgi:Ricin-type beta-trefoil lectin domain